MGKYNLLLKSLNVRPGAYYSGNTGFNFLLHESKDALSLLRTICDPSSYSVVQSTPPQRGGPIRFDEMGSKGSSVAVKR